MSQSEAVNFRVNVYLKNLVGKELITNQFVALFELIKNSYDAKASSVEVLFDSKESSNESIERIIISDDGSGMSRKDIDEKWLFLGYSDKRDLAEERNLDFRTKVRGGSRLLSGFKGIGRFSCDRLGSKLEMYTKKEDDERWHHLTVDWKMFETADSKAEFQDIKGTISDVDDLGDIAPIEESRGTVLIITELRDLWDGESLLRLRRYLQRMTNPYSISSLDEFVISLRVPSYLPSDKERSENDRINGVIRNVILEDLKLKTTRIQAKVHDNWIETTLTDEDKLIFNLRERGEFKFLKELSADIFFLNQRAKTEFTRVMGIEPVRFGSIFFYRNNFRVMPYGDEGDDWLGLELERGQGWKRFLSARELLGRVAVVDKEGDFDEVSSRAGGIKNPNAQEELKEFIKKKVINRLQKYVVEAINWGSDKTPTNKEEKDLKSLSVVSSLIGSSGEISSLTIGENLAETIREKELGKLPELIDTVEKVSETVLQPEAREYLKENTQAIKRAVREMRKEITEREKEILFLDQTARLRGPLAPVFQHEINIVRSDILPNLNKAINRLSGSEGFEDVAELLRTLRLQVERIVKIADLSLTAKFDLSTEKFEGDLVAFITQYVNRTKKDFLESNGMSVSFSDDSGKFKTTINPYETSIILDNLISNSQKNGGKKVRIQFENAGKHLKVLFSDNGPGVKEDIVKELFNPGISGTGGTGLGLYSIRKLAEAIEGSARFLGNGVYGQEKGACFEVVF